MVENAIEEDAVGESAAGDLLKMKKSDLNFSPGSLQ